MIKVVAAIGGVYSILFMLLIGVAYIGSGSGSAKHYAKDKTRMAKAPSVVAQAKIHSEALNRLRAAKKQY